MATQRKYRIVPVEVDDAVEVTILYDAVTGAVATSARGNTAFREGERALVRAGTWKRKRVTLNAAQLAELEAGNVRIRPSDGAVRYIGKRHHMDTDPRP